MTLTRQPLRVGGSTTTTVHLRGLLDLARLVHREPAPAEVLTAVASTVARTLGFAAVAVNLYRPETDEYEVSTVYGNDEASRALLGQVMPAESWYRMLQPRFWRRGAYFIPAGALDYDDTIKSYTPHLEPDPQAGEAAWRSEDALLVTLEGSAGRHYGVMSLDEPESGLRPNDGQLDVLSALAAHAALAIESADLFAQLQEAIARNRAVIESSLDAVIAVDKRGRVLEFNSAAERTFGFSVADVRGRELAELIVPPESRERHRRALARGIERGEWQLLDRRIEMIAQRADGSRLPVELALTLVPGPAEAGPVIYGFVRDISERRRSEEQLAYLAYHDPLTGAANRILVEQGLDLALARARRGRASVVLMFVDLDDFKAVNDRLGHAAGDRLLAAVAKRFRAVLRETDMLARHGGDEFIVVLADVEDDPGPVAETVGGKLLDALREPFVVAGSEMRISASIGISLYPDDAADTEALMRHADVAMYQTKAAGGGHLTFHRHPRGSDPHPAQSPRRVPI